MTILRHPTLPVELTRQVWIPDALQPDWDAGFVCWTADPQVGQGWAQHRETFVDAIGLASQFVENSHAVGQLERLERAYHQVLAVGEMGIFILRSVLLMELTRRPDGSFIRNDRGFPLLGTVADCWTVYADRSLPHDVCLLWNQEVERPRVCRIQITDVDMCPEWQGIRHGLEFMVKRDDMTPTLRAEAMRWLVPSNQD